MKKVLKVIILAIIFYLCIVPYKCTKAENETEQTTQEETENNNQTESNQNEENEQKPADSNTTDDEHQADSNNNSTDKDETTQPVETSEKETKKSPTKKTTKQPTTQVESSNANLSDLGITPNDFKGFKPGTLNYSVTVPNNVEKVNVYAKTQDAKAKITSGIGNHNLNVGENAIQIIVTAENGATQTYTINVTREENAQEENKEQEILPNSDLKKLEVKGFKITPAFSANIYEYKLDVDQDVTDLDIITEGANDQISIEIVGNTDLKVRRKYNYYFGKK